jgi:hypothetical protein
MLEEKGGGAENVVHREKFRGKVGRGKGGGAGNVVHREKRLRENWRYGGEAGNAVHKEKSQRES